MPLVRYIDTDSIEVKTSTKNAPNTLLRALRAVSGFSQMVGRLVNSQCIPDFILLTIGRIRSRVENNTCRLATRLEHWFCVFLITLLVENLVKNITLDRLSF